MFSIIRFYLLALLCMIIGCQAVKSSESGSGLKEPELDDRSLLVRRLSEQDVLNDQRLLTHLSHTCSLQVNGNRYPVLDVRELVPKGDSPRGVNRIVILNSSLISLNMIEYVGSRPLFCEANRLYLYEKLPVDGFQEPANVLTFDSWGAVEAAEYIPLNRW